MRVLIVVAAVIVLFVFLGWLTWTNEPGRPGVHLETQEIREDTGEALERGSELLRDAREEVSTGAADDRETPQQGVARETD